MSDVVMGGGLLDSCKWTEDAFLQFLSMLLLGLILTLWLKVST